VFLLEIHLAEMESLFVCVCEITPLCSVVSSVLRTVQKYDFCLVIDKTLNNAAKVRCILLSKGQYFLLA